MSGDGWTVKTVHRHLQRQIDDMRYMLNERYASQTDSVRAALEATEKAVGKAEIAAEKRFDSVNEFRQQLGDQASTFMPRAEAEMTSSRNAERINTLTSDLQALPTRAETTVLADRNTERFNDLTTRLTRIEGKGEGHSSAWIYLVGAITTIETIMTIYLAVKKS